MGHHLLGHTVGKIAVESMELEADRFAGCVVARLKLGGVLNGSLENAKGVYRRLGSAEPVGTHPGRETRKISDRGLNVGSGPDYLACLKMPKIPPAKT